MPCGTRRNAWSEETRERSPGRLRGRPADVVTPVQGASMNPARIDPGALIGQTITVTIDRPLGSRHPTHGFTYLLNYGFLPGTVSGDGEPLDAYVVGVFEPVDEFTGDVIAVIRRLDDDDDKLVVAPPGRPFSDAELLVLTEFQERFFKPVVLR